MATAGSARDLDRLMKKLAPKSDVLVMAAAVADVRPSTVASAKIKKDRLKTVRFVKNPDILANLARRKKKGQVFIGFGLETADLEKAGASKLRKKGLELIVLQKVGRGAKPFGERAVDAVLLDKSGKIERYCSVSKRKLAGVLVRRAEEIHKDLARWPSS